MSVRAYKIKGVAETESFNLWHLNRKIMDSLLMHNKFYGNDTDECYIELSLEGVDKIERECRGKVDDEGLDEFLESVRADMGAEGCAHYMCY